MKSRQFKIFRIVCCFIACLALLVCFQQLFDPLSHWGASESERSRSFLKKISSGIIEFHNEHDYFPWEDPRLRNGEFSHSWRVVLLPVLEKVDSWKFSGASELFEKYRFDEAWNSAHNLRLAQEASNYYALDQEGTFTSILAVDPPAEEQNLSQEAEFKPLGITLLQYDPWATHWMNPQNLSLDRVEALVDQMGEEWDVNASNQFYVLTSDFCIYEGFDWIDFNEARRQVSLKSDQRKAEEKSKLVDEPVE